MPGFSDLTAITGANTATGDLFLVQDVSAGTAIKERKITRAELALAMVEAGLVKVDGSGNIVATGIVPRTGTAAAINAITLADGEIASTNDTNELRLGDGSTAGGKAVGTPTYYAPTLANDTRYQIPAGSDVLIYIENYNVTVPTTGLSIPSLMRLNTMKAGDRLRIFINQSTGATITGQYLFHTADLGESEAPQNFSGWIIKPDGTYYSIVAGDAIGITAENNIYIDMTVMFLNGGNPFFMMSIATNVEQAFP